MGAGCIQPRAHLRLARPAGWCGAVGECPGPPTEATKKQGVGRALGRSGCDGAEGSRAGGCDTAGGLLAWIFSTSSCSRRFRSRPRAGALNIREGAAPPPDTRTALFVVDYYTSSRSGEPAGAREARLYPAGAGPLRTGAPYRAQRSKRGTTTRREAEQQRALVGARCPLEHGNGPGMSEATAEAGAIDRGLL